MGNVTWTFADKVVVVTGASRGIGLATANLFADAGAEVYAVSRSGASAGLRSSIQVIRADVGSSEALIRATAVAAGTGGRIDICVANAGAVLVEDYERTASDAWTNTLNVNLVGVMRTWQCALSYMGRGGIGGRLIATSSGAGVRGEPDLPAYSAAKAGIRGLVQALAVVYAAQGITVNAVAPGEVESALNRQGREAVARRHRRGADDLIRELVSEHIPAARLGRPDDVANLIAFLASDEASYITGQIMVIDGGQLLV